MRRSILGARFKNAKTESDAESACYLRAALGRGLGLLTVVSTVNEISRLSILADRDPAFRPGDLYSCLETTVEVVPFPGRQL